MNQTKLRAWVLLGGLVLSASALADDFDKRYADASLLQNKNVQTELGMSEGLRAKLNKHADAFNEAMGALQTKYAKDVEAARKAGAKQPPPFPAEKAQAIDATLRKNVIGELSESQVKRLRELSLQIAGYQAFLDDGVAKRCGLNQTQVKKLRTAFEDNTKKLASLQQMIEARIQAKYKDKKPKDEAEAKKLSEDYQADMQKEIKASESQFQEIRSAWIYVVKHTVNAKQRNVLESLQGKAFKW